MKMLALVAELAFTVVMTFGFCVYIGKLLNQIVAGIFFGFILSMIYLAWIIYQNCKG